MVNYDKSKGMQLLFALNSMAVNQSGVSLLPSQQAVSRWDLSGGVSLGVLSHAYLRYYHLVDHPLENLAFLLDRLDFDQSYDAWLWHKTFVTHGLRL